MSRLKVFSVAVAGVLSLLVSSPGYGTPLDQYSPDPTPPAPAELSNADTIPYHGNLSGIDDHPVADGSYDFQFSLFESQDNHAPFWSEEQQDVPVANGEFSLQLGSAQRLPPSALQSDQLLLQVAVRGPGEGGYTPLEPPQFLIPQFARSPESPTINAACAHDHFGEQWTGDTIYHGLTIINSKNGGRGAGFYGDILGVSGESDSGYGIAGVSTSGYGGLFYSYDDHLDLQLGGSYGRVNADEYDESTLWLSSNSDVVLGIDNDGGENHYVKVKNSGGTNVCTIDESGNLDCNGTKSAVVDTPNYGKREMYAIEGTEVWFEDIGSAELSGGQAFVAFDEVFAETVNLALDYQVTLTPVCPQPLLLSVSEKTSQGFSVLGVTLDDQPSDCGFDYRVTAKRLGYEGQRLEQVDAALQETP